MLLRLKLVAALSMMLASGCEMPQCYLNGISNVWDLPIGATTEFKSGLQIDCPMCSRDEVFLIAERVRSIYDCVVSVMDSAIAQEYVSYFNCPRATYDKDRVSLQCMTIKVVPPVYSECSEWLFIGVDAPQYMCDAKGADSACRCQYRMGIQDDYTIVTPWPDVYLWDVVTALTGCANIWQSPFSHCIVQQLSADI